MIDSLTVPLLYDIIVLILIRRREGVMNNFGQGTLEMRKNYIKLKSLGLTVEDIAEKYRISTPVVYANLQFIADTHNIDRESLLIRKHNNSIPDLKEGVYADPFNLVAVYSQDDFALMKMDELKAVTRKIINGVRNGAWPDDL